MHVNVRKIVNKSIIWAGHGQHKGMAQEVARRNREQAKTRRPVPEMFGSLRELFQTAQRTTRHRRGPKLASV